MIEALVNGIRTIVRETGYETPDAPVLGEILTLRYEILRDTDMSLPPARDYLLLDLLVERGYAVEVIREVPDPHPPGLLGDVVFPLDGTTPNDGSPIKGGDGSGNFGHEGRPGQVGGSAPDDTPNRECE